MKITRFVRMQLTIFAIVTVVSIIAMAVYYIRLPQMAGIGKYTVTLQLPSSGGLYQNANVSYRGVNVGKVSSVTLTDTGVAAKLDIESSAKIPADSQASVRSVSAVGEQFVEFTPRNDGDGAKLSDGAVVTSDDIPVEISTMLDQATALLNKVSDTKLRALMDEAFVAFNGTGEQLQRLLDSMVLLVDDANKNSDQLIDLVRQGGDVLSTQSATADDIRAWTANVTKVTDQLRANKPEITDILSKGPGVASQSQQLFESMNQSIPLLVNNLSATARTLAIYHPNLQQIIVIYPRLINALTTVVNTGDTDRYGANVDFALGFQDPGTCTVGFLPYTQWRGGGAQTPRQLPAGMLCRVPQDSQLAVRGARNFPCAEFPGRRAPSPAECRTGYKSKGENVALPNGLPFGLKLPGNLQPQTTTPAAKPTTGNAVPQGAIVPATPSSYDPAPAVYSTTYDPQTGDYIGPDGKTYNAGLGTDSQGKDTTWQSLVTATP
ncbi:MCE family protein [Gordonia sp. TBRC 11910]|uniref:MCE family protein n=1 Tax=Gordonia asplenii TaxID=2725283 RepID=A0A848LAX6_9ACTN|nr:MCE family protein [Gordonia asplenii]NMO04728.1 MCE family protein [Gordonia asplenii]